MYVWVSGRGLSCLVCARVVSVSVRLLTICRVGRQWLEWLEGDAWRSHAGGDSSSGSSSVRPYSGLLLKRSVVVSMPDYLRGLWLTLDQQQQGQASVRWEQATASSLNSLLDGSSGPCDAVVLASGAGIR